MFKTIVGSWKRIAIATLGWVPLAIAPISPAVSQSKFSDIQDHWAQSCIDGLAQKRILNGYPDGTFRPNASVTRAEFATLLDIAFPDAEAVREPIRFVDIPTNFWAARPINAVYERGFLAGYLGRIFNPNQKIPRVQVLVGLTAGLKYSPNRVAAEILAGAFEDAGDIPDYAKNAIAAATERSLVVNYPNVSQFNPNKEATRAEVAAFLCQTLIEGGSPVLAEYVARPDAIVAGTEPNPAPEANPEPGSPAEPNPAPEAAPEANPEPAWTNTGELRGVWLTNIDSDVLFSREGITQAMQRLAQLNFNTVYPAVWNWGYTLYPSQVAERTFGRRIEPDPGLKGRDILAEITKHGRDKGLRVIPWFEFGFMAPADSELARRRPEWITNRLDGTQIKMEGDHPRVWLNPFHPEVQQFILDLILEIVINYDIDGIQFDDHFGLPSEFGYDEFTVALYQKENAGQSPPKESKDPAWIRWRAAKITEFKERVFKAIKERKQDCIISLSPNPQRFSYEFFLADWETWERRGYIEELIVQLYRDDLNIFIQELERPEVQAALTHIPVGIGILSGLKGRQVSMAQIQKQLEIVREKGFAGVSFFFYESLWNWAPVSPESREAALAELFPEKIVAPSLVQEQTESE